MARVSYVEPQQAPPEVKQIYEQKLKGKPINLQKTLAHRPELLSKFVDFYASVGKALDKRLYELVYIRVAMINQCEY
jgi:alkylhydroperoxidase family enzyme